MKLFIILIFLPLLKCSESEKSLSRQKRLLFPQFTTLQTSMCLISQISQLPDHRVAVNLGFQTNYNLPYQLSSWYSPMFWARKLSKTSNPLVDFFERLSERNDENDEEDNEDSARKLADEKYPRAKRDITAAQFYVGMMDSFNYVGYHDDCVLKSICELAKYPLAHNETEEDLMTELVHFILTPSVHQAFDENEVKERELFEEAEIRGRHGHDCELIYSECEQSPLHAFSNLIID